MKKTDLCGAPERRAIAVPFEFRSSVDELALEGYASVFNAPYDLYGGPAKGGWTEIVDRKAFEVTLRGKPDVHLLINHEGMPLARTKSGTLQLSTDSKGLVVRATLDRGDPDVQRLERKMTRGDMDEMSFAFRTIRDEWNEDESERRLVEVSIDKGDVSVVNFGANPATSTELVRSLAAGDERVLAEVRSISGVDFSAAARNLARLARETGASKTLTLAEARRLAG